MSKVKRHVLLTLFGFTLLAAPVLEAKGEGTVPGVISLFDDSYPEWVSADRALTPSGELDPTLFSEISRSTIARLLATPPDRDCIRLGKVFEYIPAISGPERRGNLTDAIRNSDWVLLARVTARAGGFFADEPGTLLVVEPAEVFKGFTRRNWEHYIFMPVGNFQVGNSMICKTHPDYAELPKVGDLMLLLIDLTAHNRKSDFLETGQETGIITFPSETEVSLPRRYREGEQKSGSMSRSDLLHLVRQLTGSKH